MHEYLAFIDGCHVPPFDVFTVFGTSLCTFVSLLSSGLVLHPLGVFAILRARCTVPPSIESIARKDDWTYSNMMYTVYCILIYIKYTSIYIYTYIHSTYWYLEVVNGFELARTWAYLLKLIYLQLQHSSCRSQKLKALRRLRPRPPQMFHETLREDSGFETDFWIEMTRIGWDQ